MSLQPNAGSQGEFAGLLAIHNYHRANGEAGRDVCLIPASAHGTNAASAVMAGLRVVVVKTSGDQGEIDLDDLRAKIAEHADELAAIMVTYPSTHGVFEDHIGDVCAWCTTPAARSTSTAPTSTPWSGWPDRDGSARTCRT